MANEPTTRNLAQRLCAIMGECENLPKSGWNAYRQFHYVTESDVASMMRKLLAKHGVFLTCSIVELTERPGLKEIPIIRVKVEYMFINADAPEQIIQLWGYGEAPDNDNKGLYIALTNCHKYFFIRNFHLGSEDDAERDDIPPLKQVNKTLANAQSPSWHYYNAATIPQDKQENALKYLEENGATYDPLTKVWSVTRDLPLMKRYEVTQQDANTGKFT